MKRNFERILFMVIGALIAFFAYLVGNAERKADAQDSDLGKIIQCDTLSVKKQIIVGNADTSSVGIFVDNDSAGIRIGFNAAKNISHTVTMGVSEDHAFMELKDHPTGHIIMTVDKETFIGIGTQQGHDPEHPDSAAIIGTGEDGTGIIIKDSKGTKILRNE